MIEIICLLTVQIVGFIAALSVIKTFNYIDEYKENKMAEFGPNEIIALLTVLGAFITIVLMIIGIGRLLR